ncbi:MAG: hypothetical protein LBT45_02225 [Rickettsiales bacterium]|jgi:DnaJ-domain-containing protein 1|nr:hypothetical protein [Rickettsiales bacterium]
MIVKKCEHPNCDKAGTCRCPKDRTLSSYWHFCQKHAAEYNKNWNYYAGMTAEEIEKDWERSVFGTSEKSDGADYQKLIRDFLSGRMKRPSRKKAIPDEVLAALKTFGLTIVDNWAAVQKIYRILAKREHPDTGKSKEQSRFIKISQAYQTLKKFFNK